jgi:hypothetical protein
MPSRNAPRAISFLSSSCRRPGQGAGGGGGAGEGGRGEAALAERQSLRQARDEAERQLAALIEGAAAG